MRAATLITIVFLASCRPQNAAVTTRDADSLSFADVTPRDSADSTLLQPRVISEPTVVVFWLSGADTLSADDQAQALDELNYTTEGIASTARSNSLTAFAEFLCKLPMICCTVTESWPGCQQS